MLTCQSGRKIASSGFLLSTCSLFPTLQQGEIISGGALLFLCKYLFTRYFYDMCLLPTIAQATDYGRPMKPIFIEIQNFWAWHYFRLGTKKGQGNF